jgi:predicted TIM-barrel fold metal-dependent hydrolase
VRTRREFLRTGLTAAGGLALGCAGLTAGERGDDWIDSQVHIWSDDQERFPLDERYREEPLVPAAFTVETLIAMGEAEGVQRFVAIEAPHYGRDFSYLEYAAKKYPGRIAMVGVVDASPRGADQVRDLAGRGFAGARVFVKRRADASWLQQRRADLVFQAAADTGLKLCLLSDARELPLIDQMCARFPDTPVVLDHLGMVGRDGVVRPAELEQLKALARHDNIVVKASRFYDLGRKKAPYTDIARLIRPVLASFGPDRMMWGSDCPYQLRRGHGYEASLDLVRWRAEFLSDSDREKLLRGTAERVFFS